MIALPDVDLDVATEARLMRYQGRVDREPNFSRRVDRAKAVFKSANRVGNSAFDEVKKALTSMSSGVSRCHYCEDSAHDEVEHIAPKHLYPELCFAWRNYLYSCGPCNGPKGSRFAVMDPAGNVTEMDRNWIGPPADGQPLLVDPRRDDPSRFFGLDLADTFRLVPITAPNTIDHRRATYTLQVLRLNTREYLPAARAAAYEDYRAALLAASRLAGDKQETARLRKQIERRSHPTVWFEMKRQRRQLRELDSLFSAVPQALDWGCT